MSSSHLFFLFCDPSTDKLIKCSLISGIRYHAFYFYFFHLALLKNDFHSSDEISSLFAYIVYFSTFINMFIIIISKTLPDNFTLYSTSESASTDGSHFLASFDVSSVLLHGRNRIWKIATTKVNNSKTQKCADLFFFQATRVRGWVNLISRWAETVVAIVWSNSPLTLYDLRWRSRHSFQQDWRSKHQETLDISCSL